MSTTSPYGLPLKIDLPGVNAPFNGHTKQFTNGLRLTQLLKMKPDKLGWQALRAVVELHQPHKACSEGCLTAGWCEECMEPPYPCPTIQAIERELG